MSNSENLEYGMFLTLIPTVTRLIRAAQQTGTLRALAEWEFIVVTVQPRNIEDGGYLIHIAPGNSRRCSYNFLEEDVKRFAGAIETSPFFISYYNTLLLPQDFVVKVLNFKAVFPSKAQGQWLTWTVNADVAGDRGPVLREPVLYSDPEYHHEWFATSTLTYIDALDVVSQVVTWDEVMADVAAKYAQNNKGDAFSAGGSITPEEVLSDFVIKYALLNHINDPTVTDRMLLLSHHLNELVTLSIRVAADGDIYKCEVAFAFQLRGFYNTKAAYVEDFLTELVMEIGNIHTSILFNIDLPDLVQESDRLEVIETYWEGPLDTFFIKGALGPKNGIKIIDTLISDFLTIYAEPGVVTLRQLDSLRQSFAITYVPVIKTAMRASAGPVVDVKENGKSTFIQELLYLYNAKVPNVHEFTKKLLRALCKEHGFGCRIWTPLSEDMRGDRIVDDIEVIWCRAEQYLRFALKLKDLPSTL